MIPYFSNSLEIWWGGVRCCDQVLSIASRALLNVLLRQATFTRMKVSTTLRCSKGVVCCL